jgi:L-iditol 2-dehydrogenase
MFTRLLALRGFEVVASDLLADRLRLAKAFGARAVLRADDPDLDAKVARRSGGRGPDAVVVAVASDRAVGQAQALVRGAGQVLLFAHTRRGEKMELDLSGICVDEKDLIGSYSSDVTLQPEAARLVFSRKLDVRSLISHRFPLEQTAAAIQQASSPSGGSLKVIVEQGWTGNQ